jgi:FMN phosphatase YigB (HAD superfamily)
MIEDVELIGESKICIPRKIKQKPKVLICDFGNVIMLFDRSRTYRAIGHWFRISHKKVATIIEGTTLRQKYEKGELNDKEFYNEVIALFKTSFEMPYELFSEFWGDIFWPNGNVIEALNLLQKEVKLVLLSNTNSLHFANVKEHYGDIVSLFEDRLILSYKEKIAKPDKRIFEKALQVAGADITFSDCIYVDDKVEYVNVANRLGMKGIVFYSYPQFVYSIRELGLYIP